MGSHSLKQRTIHRFNRKPWLAATTASALALAVFAVDSPAAYWDDGGGDTNWMNGLNWDTDSVPSGVVAEIPQQTNVSFNSTVDLHATAPSITYLNVGLHWGFMSVTPTLNIGQGGLLVVSTTTAHEIAAMIGLGLGRPTVNMTGNGYLYVGATTIFAGGGNFAGGHATFNLTDTATFSTRKLMMSFSGHTSTLNQSGNSTVTIRSVAGQFESGDLHMAMADHPTLLGENGTCATYNMSGGTLNIGGHLIMGRGGIPSTGLYDAQAYAEFTQTGGTVNIDGVNRGDPISMKPSRNAVLSIGDSQFIADGPRRGTSVGVYNLSSGILDVNGMIALGRFYTPNGVHAGSGTIQLGDANGTGTFRQKGGLAGTARSILNREHSDSDGTISGWGDVEFTGTLTNNGRVIADGYGTSRTLNMSHFASVASTIENGTGVSNNKDISGWYAVNQGKLVLPSIAVNDSAGSFTYNWGEDASDSDIDLVNSLRLTLNKGATASQSLSVALIDPGHSEVLNLPTVHSIVGLWDIAPSFTVTSADVTFRYDQTKATALSLDENTLALYHYNSGTSSWEEITSGVSIDTTKKQLTATGLTSFSQYAIGYLEFVTAILGDLNNDSIVNNQDIAPFVLALTDLSSWEAAYPGVDILDVGDINGDSFFNNQDIAPFVTLLTGSGTSLTAGEVNAIPEPASLGLLALGGLMLISRRRRNA